MAVACSAVGLGNFFRFPGLAAQYGGGVLRCGLFLLVLALVIRLTLPFASLRHVFRLRKRHRCGFPWLCRIGGCDGHGCFRDWRRWYHRNRNGWHHRDWHWRHDRDRNGWQRWNRGGSGLRCLRNRESRDGERDEEEARGFFHEARRVGTEQARRCCDGVPWGLTPPWRRAWTLDWDCAMPEPGLKPWSASRL